MQELSHETPGVKHNVVGWSDTQPNIVTACLHANKIISSFGLSPCVQIFLGSPLTWGSPAISDDLAAQLSKLQLVIHSSYLSSPWSALAAASAATAATAKSGRSTTNSINSLKKEIMSAARINASIIVHLSAKCANDAVLDTFASCVNQWPNVRIWLETQSAKMGTYETPEKILSVYKRFRSRGLNVGICVDTAHIYACGVSLETYDFTSRWLKPLKKVPMMFHLNDTTQPIGSGKDVHIGLCKGNIWKQYSLANVSNSGIAAIVEFAIEHSSWIILENHSVDPTSSVGVLRDLALISALVEQINE